ncbi:MAG TPA: DUF1641 domain-containing protein [Rhodanobacteraceae bacterium]|nr:DUF1641 domain-containing protein [Rhodanobacteraceae bacterium]
MMAEPLKYTPRPPKIDPDAHEALEQLLQTAHEHGVLRFANDLIASNHQWTQVIVDGLNSENSRKAAQNLAMFLMLLSRIEPDQLCKVLFAARDSFEHMARHRPQDEEADAPGIKGFYNMLHDDALWQTLTPLIGAVKAFGEGLNRDVHKPVTAFAGQETKQS